MIILLFCSVILLILVYFAKTTPGLGAKIHFLLTGEAQPHLKHLTWQYEHEDGRLCIGENAVSDTQDLLFDESSNDTKLEGTRILTVAVAGGALQLGGLPRKEFSRVLSEVKEMLPKNVGVSCVYLVDPTGMSFFQAGNAMIDVIIQLAEIVDFFDAVLFVGNCMGGACAMAMASQLVHLLRVGFEMPQTLNVRCTVFSPVINLDWEHSASYWMAGYLLRRGELLLSLMEKEYECVRLALENSIQREKHGEHYDEHLQLALRVHLRDDPSDAGHLNTIRAWCQRFVSEAHTSDIDAKQAFDRLVCMHKVAWKRNNALVKRLRAMRDAQNVSKLTLLLRDELLECVGRGRE